MIAPADRTKLAAVLGMLGSDHAGERASAGLLATRILRSAGTTWRELLGVDAPPPPSGSSTADDLAVCRRHADRLTSWEVRFVDGISQQRRSLSPRQVETLARIAAELLERDAG